MLDGDWSSDVCSSDLGLGLLFTPLFSASLGSLPPELYSHGSAVIGTIQQVGGAAGTALFVSIMTLSSGRIAASGADPVIALSGGIGTALLYCAAISALAIVAAFFVRRPAGAIAGGPAMH
jgi:DHA2 family lincomycin resistance protein-like MFS transporter